MFHNDNEAFEVNVIYLIPFQISEKIFKKSMGAKMINFILSITVGISPKCPKKFVVEYLQFPHNG